jgi:ABC-type branched-subunit amino acid transport system substrate-binding protein
MKKIIFGTIAAATVIASATAASAQNRTERNWMEMRTQNSIQQSWEQPTRRRGVSYGYNLRFERADQVN